MQTLINYAMSWLGTPYKWGGSGRDGIDCSGLVQEILKTCNGCTPTDRTASQIHEYFVTEGRYIPTPKAGALVFYGREKVSHVAFSIDNWRIIEAAGGDRNTNTREDAVHRNAWVRIRPYDYRSDLLGIIMPNYKRVQI